MSIRLRRRLLSNRDAIPYHVILVTVHYQSPTAVYRRKFRGV